MKRFSEHIKESKIINNGVTFGNSLNNGVTNHYTPVQNILTNIKNLFCQLLGVYAEVAEDGFSIKLSSVQFTSEQKTSEILHRPMYNDVFSYGTSSLEGYIMSQGLRKVTLINLGSYYVVYFSPEDIKAAQSPINMENNIKGYTSVGEYSGECCPNPCEMKESLYDEFELCYLKEKEDNSNNSNDNSGDQNNNNDSSSDEPNNTDNSSNDNSNSDSDDKISEILNNEDKVKAAKQLEIIISQKIQLSREFYFTAIKFKNEDEAIALRWKYDKKLPNGKSTENVRSIMHIFGTGENAIWVQDYAKDSIVELPKAIKQLIENVLKILGAKSTHDPAIFNLRSGSSDDSNSDDQNNGDDNQNDDQNNNDGKNNDDSKSVSLL